MWTESRLARFRRVSVRFFGTVVLLIGATSSSAWCQARRTGDVAVARKAVIDTVAALLEKRYVLPAQGRAFADSLRSRGASETWDTLAARSFAEAVTADLRAITGDAHLLLRAIEPSDVGERAQSPLHHPVRLFQLSRREHLGIARLEWLEGEKGNIGYMDLRRFYPLSESKATIDAAMRFLAGADAVIIDLRENGGGAGESLPYIMRYFLPYPTRLTSYESRTSDFPDEFWTVKDVGAPRLPDVPLFLLTGQRTFSAAEAFAYDLKVRDRATLVGGATGGGARSVDLFPVSDTFEVYLSTAQAVNPVTNGNWEGTGVLPDVVVPEDAALDTAIALARGAARKYREPKDSALAVAVQRMERALARAQDDFRSGRAAEGDAALADLVGAGIDYGLINEFFLSVLAGSCSEDADRALLLAVLRKKVDLFPYSAEAHEMLATALAVNGNEQSARMHYLRALELDPDNRNVRKKLERLGRR